MFLVCIEYKNAKIINKKYVSDEMMEFSLETQYILSLLKSSILDSELVSVPSDADVSVIARIIVSNGILLTVFPIISKDSSSNGILLQQSLKKKYLKYFTLALQQDLEGKRIQFSLNKKGIDFIALKGWELRLLYPDVYRRNMADLDYLIKDYDYRSIKTIMEELGFSAAAESSWKHDNFTKKNISVEMHKRLTDNIECIYNWEYKIWDRAVLISNTDHGWRMSEEDFYIFHLLHLFKDFKNGSLGLRRITDTWLIINRYKNFDEDYLNNELKSMGLELFRERLETLARYCFEDIPADNNCIVMINHAVNTGIYGNGRSYKLGRIVTMSGIDGTLRRGKFHSFINAVFLPPNRMKAHFPILLKHPVLLPFCWFVRILQQLRTLSINLKRLDYSGITESDYYDMKEFLKAGGVTLE